MQVTIYSTTSCPYCKMLKDYLSGRGIRYSEKMVDLDETAKAEMASLSGGFLGVPFTLISKDDGTKDTVIGFDERKLSQLI
ncbi:MAG: Glutaredoxin [uncultured bacterium]|nr:MAG: Glutaredoxin [uncultured bacterium]